MYAGQELHRTSQVMVAWMSQRMRERITGTKTQNRRNFRVKKVPYPMRRADSHLVSLMLLSLSWYQVRSSATRWESARVQVNPNIRHTGWIASPGPPSTAFHVTLPLHFFIISAVTFQLYSGSKPYINPSFLSECDLFSHPRTSCSLLIPRTSLISPFLHLSFFTLQIQLSPPLFHCKRGVGASPNIYHTSLLLPHQNTYYLLFQWKKYYP